MKKLFAIYLALLLMAGLMSACVPFANLGNGGDDNKSAAYVPGESTATGWKSSFIGLQYTPDSSMVMATKQEIENMMELGADVMFQENGQQMVDWAKVTTVYEMMATNTSNGSNVIICAEKLTLSNMTEAQYMEALKKQLGSVYTSGQFSDVTSMTVAGIQFSRMDLKASLQGVSINQTYLCVKIENRMIGLICTCTTANALDSLLKGFSAYQG